MCVDKGGVTARLSNAIRSSFVGMPLKEERSRANEELAVVSRCAGSAMVDNGQSSVATFREIAEVWVQRHGKPNKTAGTLANDCLVLDFQILPEIGDMIAAEVTEGDVIRMLDKVAAKPIARWRLAGKSTQRPSYHPSRVLNLTRSIFRWAVGHELLKFDPCLGVKAPKKVDGARERALSPEEIRILWRVLGTAPEKLTHRKGNSRGEKVRINRDNLVMRPTALMLLISLTTGQRIGEVAGIAKDEVDLIAKAPVWVVPGDRTKNGKPNRIPLSRLAVSLMREADSLSGESKWLFPSPCGNGPIEPLRPTGALPCAREHLGLADFRVHDLRRTAAVRMAECGVDSRTISLVLNYSRVREGAVMGELNAQDWEKREALDKWAARLERIIAEEDAANVDPIRLA